MACLHPNLILKTKLPTDEKWTVEFHPDIYSDEIPQSLIDIRNYRVRLGVQCEIVNVPCGNCINCRMAYARQWASRCALEASLTPERNYFVTLTYDNNHLHWSSEGLPTLFYDDMTKFIKRLRRHNQYHYGDQDIRYYYCGEYGDTTARPHYHILLFNVTLLDLKPISKNKFGNVLYTSQTLEELWSHGLVCVGDLNWNTAAYTARYVMKKHKGFDRLMYQQSALAEPKVQMSRRPGIGVPWMQQYGSYLFKRTSVDSEGFPVFSDSILVPTNSDKAIRCKPPRLFERYSDADELTLDQVHEMRRRVAEIVDHSRRTHVMECDREYFSKLDDTIAKSGKGFFRKFQELC